MGTGVMIGAGTFALTGQIAELVGPWFTLCFLAGAIVTAFSGYRQTLHNSVSVGRQIVSDWCGLATQ